MASSSSKFDPRSLDLAVGGQAVLEGVMMRCPTAVATAVRTPSGQIVVKHRPYVGIVNRRRLLNIPLLRGAITLVESLALGFSSLMYSAEQALEEEAVVREEHRVRDRFTMWGMMAFAFVFGLGIFFYLPLILAGLTGVKNGFGFNLIDGALRLVIFMAYLLLISRMKDMRRVFQYHGAEHKTIHVFEHGLELKPENARRFPTLHPRCGTSFLFFVMFVSILVFLFMGRPESIVERLQRLTLVPLIGGIAYEVIKLSGKYAEQAWIKPLIWPGLMLQKITTKEPSDEQVEVAMAALTSVLQESALDPALKPQLQLAESPS
jgi:uncharacterized protein YqhQ